MKLIKLFIFIIVLFSILFISYRGVPQKHYKDGLACYNKKDYKCAADNFTKALQYDKKNIDYRYYYVKSLSELGPSYSREEALYEIANSKQNDSAKTIAQNTLQDWKKLLLNKYRDNYIEQTPSDYNIIRWNINSFPLPVYLANFESVPKYYKDAVLAALNKWSTSVNFISFKQTNNANEAKIKIQVNPFPKSTCSDNSCLYVVGYTTPRISRNTLKQMEIVLYDKDPNDKYIDEKEIYSTMVHELGHALGLSGHSYNNDDIMYPQKREKDIYTQFRGDILTLSQTDINTIKLLYSIKPNITDEKEFSEKLMYTPLVLGSKDEILQRKIDEGLDYIKQAPKLATGYINLAGVYSSIEDYKKAESYLKQALEHASDDADRFIIYYNLSYVYYKTKNYTAAEMYANLASEINNSEEVQELKNAINIQKN